VRLSALTLGAFVGLLFLVGCQTPAPGSATETVAKGEHFLSYIRVEGVVVGGAIKLDGTQVSMFPGYVTVEVDDAGKAVRRYVVALSTNILGGDLGQYVIEQGQEIPMRIYYERTGPVATGTALVQRQR
jgi:hypothetical protein